MQTIKKGGAGKMFHVKHGARGVTTVFHVKRGAKADMMFHVKQSGRE